MSSPHSRQANDDPLSPRASPQRVAKIISGTDHAPRHPDTGEDDIRPALSFKKRTTPAATGVSARLSLPTSGLLGSVLAGRNRQDGQSDRISTLDDTSLHSSTAPKASPGRIAGSGSLPPNSDSELTGQHALHYRETTDNNTLSSSYNTSAAPHLGQNRWSRSVSRNPEPSARQPPLRDPFESPSGSAVSVDNMDGMGGGIEARRLGPSATDSTPLPTIPIIVLCIAMFGEFLSASLSSPFLYFMIESFGVGQGDNGGGEAEVGFWTGIVSSVFFLSQFLTSLLWMSVAEKHGRRAVLLTSLIGNGLAVITFGTSKNLASAITIRFTMGLFNGAIGVARSAVQSVTDSTNETRAFTYMGLCWGLGGIGGSIIGGLTESPVKNYPGLFGSSKLFAEYPYLLPCLIAGSITLTGGVLSLWLDRDGGPRQGRIQLTEKDVDRARRTLGSIIARAANYLSSLLRQRRPSQPVHLQTTDGNDEESPIISPLVTPSENTPYRARGAGSAYGYGSRRSSEAGMRIPSRRFRDRVMSAATSNAYAPDYDVDRGDFSFAQRLLLANEQAVFSISDLWIAREAAADDETSQVEYEDSVFVDEESRTGADESRMGDSQITFASNAGGSSYFDYGSAPPSLEDLRGTAARQALRSGQVSPQLGPPGHHRTLGHSPSRDRSLLSPTRERAVSYGLGGSLRLRRPSMASSAVRVPSLFSNTGLDEQTIVTSQNAATVNSASHKDDTPHTLAAIPESGATLLPEGDASMVETKVEAFSFRQLPLTMIAQYSLLALHGCTCDQVFMSFLVTPVPSGGLGLKAANYAALVAAMVFFNTCWQFKFYPFFGPPNGPLSHLAMFRLGLALYIPVYMLFPELRGLLREDSTGWVMFGMTLLSAIRYLANTCSYTAVMVLVNAMSPPHLVPLANGLAQSTVSLARFIGPVVGGIVWSASIKNGPSANAWPFNYALGFVVIASDE
ncbi:hypothetical protein OIV83_003067 [Microbotryomycetes sp. JL201]|nr:hypothetical protein OIV83_003067 [Microbotryomycetes sp. JL201]